MDDQARVHEPAGGSPAQSGRHAVAEGRARPPHRRAEEADLLRGHPEVLPRARRRVAAREGAHDRQEQRRPRPGRRVRRRRRIDQEPGDVSRLSRRSSPIRATITDAQAEGDHRQGQADLPPLGRPAQRRGRAVRDADGAGLPPRGRRLAARQRRSATTSSSRSRRWPIPTAAIATSTGTTSTASTRPKGARPARACRTGASTSSTTTTATSTTRRSRCERCSTGTCSGTRRSCTTCISRRRCSTPSAARRRRTRTSIRSSTASCRCSRTSRWRR